MPCEQKTFQIVDHHRCTIKNSKVSSNGLLFLKQQQQLLKQDVPKSLSAQDCLLDINEKRLLFSDSSLDQDETDDEPTTSIVAPLSTSSESRPRGWYAARKAYRSVAYKTWTVGAARKILNGPKEKVRHSIRRNGFISDSDSNLEDEFPAVNSCSNSSRNYSNNNSVRKNVLLRSELFKLNGQRKAETARDWSSDFRSANEDSLKIENSSSPVTSSLSSSSSSKKRYVVRFDGKTEVDQEFRAVIDTFKDLQNFISSNKNNIYNNNVFPTRTNTNINNTNRNYCGGNNKSVSKESSRFAGNIWNRYESVDHKRFANMNQAIRYLKDELTNLRQKDFIILQNLNHLKTEIHSSTESFPPAETVNANVVVCNGEPNLPPIPKCLILN